MTMIRGRNFQRGITMIEVMATLIILGIVGMKLSQNHSMNNQAAVVDYAALSANTVANAAKKYRLQYGAWPTSTAQLVSASYLTASEATSPFGTPYTLTTSGTYLVVSNVASNASYAKRLKGVLQNGTVSGSTYSFSFQPSGWEVSLAGLYRLDGSEKLLGDMDVNSFNIRNINNVQASSINTGTLSASGSISGSSLSVSGSVSAGGSVTAGGTVRGGSLVSDGSVSAAGNANIAGRTITYAVDATGQVQANVLLSHGNTVTPYLKVHGAGADITSVYSGYIQNSGTIVTNNYTGKNTYSDSFHGGTFTVYNTLNGNNITGNTGTFGTLSVGGSPAATKNDLNTYATKAELAAAIASVSSGP